MPIFKYQPQTSLFPLCSSNRLTGSWSREPLDHSRSQGFLPGCLFLPLSYLVWDWGLLSSPGNRPSSRFISLIREQLHYRPSKDSPCLSLLCLSVHAATSTTITTLMTLSKKTHISSPPDRRIKCSYKWANWRRWNFSQEKTISFFRVSPCLWALFLGIGNTHGYLLWISEQWYSFSGALLGRYNFISSHFNVNSYYLWVNRNMG